VLSRNYFVIGMRASAQIFGAAADEFRYLVCKQSLSSNE
jgi:hypothetical protein